MGQTTSKHIDFRIIYEKEEAQRLLDEAERKDFYVEECHEDPVNALARKNTNYRAEAMTTREYKFFEVVVENVKDKLPLRLVSELSTVIMIQLLPTAEGGMPHTRPDGIIAIPNVYYTFSITTLFHELWHIHQRQYPVWWKEVFRQMKWEQWEGHLPPALENYRRYNPDTLDAPLWCYDRTWIPVPVFRDIVRPRVNEADIWFYHVTLKYHVKNPPRELLRDYPTLPANGFEHPREMAAYLLSEPTRYESCPGLEKWKDVVGAISLPRM